MTSKITKGVVPETVISNPIILGETYAESVTGFEGVAKAYIIYLTGADQVQLGHVSDGKLYESWFEASTLSRVTE